MLSSTFLSSVQISRDYLVSIVGLLPKKMNAKVYGKHLNSLEKGQ